MLKTYILELWIISRCIVKAMHLKQKTDLKFGTEGVHSLLLNDINNHFSLHHETQDIEFARLKNHNCGNITM